MDAALLAEREAFKRRAMAVPTVENKKKKTDDSKKSSGSMKPPKGGSYKQFGSVGSSYKFGVLGRTFLDTLSKKKVKYLRFGKKTNSKYQVQILISEEFLFLAKIVRHMKHRHMEGEDHPLTLDEILDETNQLDISGATKQWLLLEALGTFISYLNFHFIHC